MKMAHSENLSDRKNKLDRLVWPNESLRWNSGNSCSRDTVLDAFLALYDECNYESLIKQHKHVADFVHKWRNTVVEVRRLRVNITDYTHQATLANNPKAHVQVCVEHWSNCPVVLKGMRKSEVVAKQAFTERDLLAARGSPHHLRLLQAFHDTTHLYLVTEWCPGGDLSRLLARRDQPLMPHHAAFYVKGIAAGLHHLHALGYAHRDLSTHNVLLDREGQVKLADFGCAARVGSSEQTVGTADYISPEALQGAVGSAGDWWALGVIAFEMITLRRPFSDEQDTEAVIIANIEKYARGSIGLPWNETENEEALGEWRALVGGLLEPKVPRRLGHTIIMSHPALILAPHHAPWRPKLEGPLDTRYFPPVTSRRAPNTATFRPRAPFASQQISFVGFTWSEPDDDTDSSSFTTGSQPTVVEVDVGPKKEKERELERERLQREVTELVLCNQRLARRLQAERDDRRAQEARALKLIAKHKLRQHSEIRVKALDSTRSVRKSCGGEERLKSLCVEVMEARRDLAHAQRAASAERARAEDALCRLEAARGDLLATRHAELAQRHQLDALRRECANHEQEMSELRTELRQALLVKYRLEREVRESTAEARVAERESERQRERLALAHDARRTALAQLKEQREAAQQLEAQLQAAKQQLQESDVQLKGVQRQLERAQDQLSRCQEQLKEAKAQCDMARAEASEARRAGEAAAAGAARAQGAAVGAGGEARRHRDLHERTLRQLAELQREHAACTAVKQNFEALKVTCGELEDQLSDLERLSDQHEIEAESYKKEVEVLRQELKGARDQIEEWRHEAEAARRAADAAEREADAARDAERRARNRSRGEASQALAQIQEECALLRTDCHNTAQELKRMTARAERAEEGLRRAAEESRATDEWWRTRETKAEATLRQQAKLIDFLQAKVETLSRKRTLAGKLFGTPCKATPPLRATPARRKSRNSVGRPNVLSETPKSKYPISTPSTLKRQFSSNQSKKSPPHSPRSTDTNRMSIHSPKKLDSPGKVSGTTKENRLSDRVAIDEPDCEQTREGMILWKGERRPHLALQLPSPYQHFIILGDSEAVWAVECSGEVTKRGACGVSGGVWAAAGGGRWVVLVAGAARGLASIAVEHLALAVTRPSPPPRLPLVAGTEQDNAFAPYHLLKALGENGSRREGDEVWGAAAGREGAVVLAGAPPRAVRLLSYPNTSPAVPRSLALSARSVMVLAPPAVYQAPLYGQGHSRFQDVTPKNDDTVEAASNANILPLTLIALDPKEFLLCYESVGIFIDEQGKRTRNEDAKWPLAPVHITKAAHHLVLWNGEAGASINLNSLPHCPDTASLTSTVEYEYTTIKLPATLNMYSKIMLLNSVKPSAVVLVAGADVDREKTVFMLKLGDGSGRSTPVPPVVFSETDELSSSEDEGSSEFLANIRRRAAEIRGRPERTAAQLCGEMFAEINSPKA